MNARDVLSRMEGEVAAAPQRLAASDRDCDAIDAGCFAFTRSSKDRAGTLTLKTVTGNACSIDWTWAPDIVYLPGHEIPLTLIFPTRGFKVEILGSRLSLLVDCLQQRRVVSIQAQDRMQQLACDGGDAEKPHVEEFRIVAMQEGEEVGLMQKALHGGRSAG